MERKFDTNYIFNDIYVGVLFNQGLVGSNTEIKNLTIGNSFFNFNILENCLNTSSIIECKINNVSTSVLGIRDVASDISKKEITYLFNEGLLSSTEIYNTSKISKIMSSWTFYIGNNGNLQTHLTTI